MMVCEYYSHVIHIVSNVCANLSPKCDPLFALLAAFPGGTITGAPKIRSMEIIEELEFSRRGPYTGSMGYFSDSGILDMNILIRTYLLSKNKGCIRVGAGIVSDSDPEREYLETLHKGEALVEALIEESCHMSI